MSIARNSFWALVGVGGQQFLRFIVVIFLARLLTPTEFGIVAAAQIFISLGEVFANFGLGTALIQAKDLDRELERSAMSLNALVSGGIALALAAGAPLIAQSIGIPQVASILPFLAVGLFLQGIAGMVSQLMFRQRRYREMAAIQLSSYGIGYGATAIGLALVGWSYWAVVAGALCQNMILLVGVFLRRPTGFTFRVRWSRLGSVLHFGFGVLVGNLLTSIARKGDNWVAGRMLGAAALGFYSRAYSLMDLANEVPGIVFSRVLLPHFSRKGHADDDRADGHVQFYLAHVAGALISAPAMILSFLLAPEIVHLLLGDKWDRTIPVFAVLAFGIPFRLGYKISATVNVAYGGVWQAASRHLVYAILVVVGSLVGAQYGLVGIAYAVLLALFWQFWVLTALALRQSGGTWRGFGGALAPVLVASCTAIGAGLAARALLDGAWGDLIDVAGVTTAVFVFFAAVVWLWRRHPCVAPLVGLVFDLVPALARWRTRASSEI